MTTWVVLVNTQSDEVSMSFLLFVFILHHVHRSRCMSDLDQWQLKMRHSAQGCAIWGFEWCYL